MERKKLKIRKNRKREEKKENKKGKEIEKERKRGLQTDIITDITGKTALQSKRGDMTESIGEEK